MPARAVPSWLRTLLATCSSALALLALYHLELPRPPAALRPDRSRVEAAVPRAALGANVATSEPRAAEPTVPSLLEEPLGRARRAAHERGLTLVARDEHGRRPFRGTGVLWRVTDQEPAPGSALPADGVVTVRIEAHWSLAEGY